jgi:hypothetical protein
MARLLFLKFRNNSRMSSRPRILLFELSVLQTDSDVFASFTFHLVYTKTQPSRER